jgi:hypothetical protein
MISRTSGKGILALKYMKMNSTIPHGLHHSRSHMHPHFNQSHPEHENSHYLPEKKIFTEQTFSTARKDADQTHEYYMKISAANLHTQN